jgi:hypothetical protein
VTELICSIDGCMERQYGRTLCRSHYERERHAKRLAHLPRQRLVGVAPFERILRRTRVDAAGCWVWQASMQGGYGRLNMHGRKVFAHRLAWECRFGPVPDGLELDHLCRNKACCNPDHLEPVTHTANVGRGLNGVLRTHCARGHELAGANLCVQAGGRRRCRICQRERSARRRAA